VRYEVLAGFLRSTPAVVTRHRFCDLAFAFLLNHRGPSSVRLMPASADEFVYYYARAENSTPGGASTTLSLSEAEWRVAVAEEARAAILFARVRPDDLCLSLTRELMAAIEQELVKIRVTGATVPYQLVRCACAHEAGVVMASARLEPG